MAENDLPRNDELSIENVEIEPLSDDALEEVAGGVLGPDRGAGDSCTDCCSCSGCS